MVEHTVIAKRETTIGGHWEVRGLLLKRALPEEKDVGPRNSPARQSEIYGGREVEHANVFEAKETKLRKSENRAKVQRGRSTAIKEDEAEKKKLQGRVYSQAGTYSKTTPSEN